MDFQSTEVTISATLGATEHYLERLSDLRRREGVPPYISQDDIATCITIVQRARRAELLDPTPPRRED